MKINTLTGTRGIAAIMVVIHHYAAGMFPFNKCGQLFCSGNLAVSYFFVLSGFVLYISQSATPYLSFLVKRLARLLPAYLVALALSVLLLVVYYPIPKNFIQQIVFCALFVQSFLPDYVLEINPPAWSLSVEVFFYALFPILLPLTKNKKRFLVFTCLLFLASQGVHLWYCNQVDVFSGTPIFFNPVIHLNQFLVGMAGGMLYKQPLAVLKNRLAPPVLFAIAVALIMLRPATVSYQVGLIAPVFMLLVTSLALTGSWLLRTRALVYLGEISFGIYIYQHPVFKLLSKANDKHLHVSWDVGFYVCLLALIGVSALSYWALEQPLMSYVKRRLSHHARNAIVVKSTDQ